MKREVLDMHEALRRGKTLPFAWLCTLSKVTLGATPSQIPLDEFGCLTANRKSACFGRKENFLPRH